MTLVVLIGSFVVAVWVWFDAKDRDWSGNSFGKGPWWWAIGSLLLWIIVVPISVFQRGKAPVRR